MLDPRSAILSALYNRNEAEAQRLADAAAELTVWEAAALGRVAALDRLVARDPSLAGAFGPDGNVPLGLAAFFGHADAMRRLLEQGADVAATAANFMKVQPLHAAVAARSVEAVTLLLDRGADVNARQQIGYTPLMGAAAAGREDLVDMLLRHGADSALVAEDGKTAADVAREHDHEALAARILGSVGP